MRSVFQSRYFTMLWIVLSFVPNAAYGQDFYQHEIATGFFLSDDNDHNEVKIYSGQGRHYFAPIDPSGHPLKEASFLERVGSFELIVAMTDFSSDSTTGAEGPLYGGSVVYVQPGFPLFLSTGFAKSDVSYDPPIQASLSVDLYELSIGFFVQDPLLIGMGYTRIETELSQSGFPNRGVGRDHYRLFSKWVHAIDFNTALNIERTIENRTFGVPIRCSISSANIFLIREAVLDWVSL